MKYRRQGLAILMVLSIMLTIMPVSAANLLGDGEGLVFGGKLSREEDKGSVSGDTASPPNGGEEEQKKLTAVKKEVAEMAVDGTDGVQPYADGDIASGTDGNINWVIDGNGKLTVTGTGDFTRNNGKAPWCGYYGREIRTAEINIVGMTDASAMFIDCVSLTSIDITNLDTSDITNMWGMFHGCSSLSSLDVSNFNTSNVTNMGGMFYGCSSLSSLDISNFDTSNVAGMSSMFYDCIKLTDLDLSHFDTSKVTGMNDMFHGCYALENLDLSNFVTSNVANMSFMFYNCYALKNLDIGHFDTSNVEDMRNMFSGCGNLSSLDLSHFDTSNVTDMEYMFSDCSKLRNLDVSHFDTSNVTNMREMFRGCNSLNRLDVSKFNTSNVIDMAQMFSGCNSLSSLDVSHFDTSSLVTIERMLYGCSKLTELDLRYFDMADITAMGDLFSGCDSLIAIYTPCNLAQPVMLPVADEFDIWRLPDKTEITELPQNISDSMLIVRSRNPKIVTETLDLNMSDVIRVKYVPYSYTVETNNWDPDNIVTYSIEKGTLAKGLQMYPATGEIYGMPLEAGIFPITVKATFSNPRYLPSYKDLTLTVLDNTDSNVWNASDPGYEVEQYVGTQVSGSCPVLTDLTDQVFVSTGAYREFIDFWLNGEKLVEGKDYTREEGSTRITIKSQTLQEKADRNGVNTIAIEFRVGGNTGNVLKRTAQNFRIKEQEKDNSGDKSKPGDDAELEGSTESGGSAESGGGTEPEGSVESGGSPKPGDNAESEGSSAPGDGAESGGNSESGGGSGSGRSTQHTENIAPVSGSRVTAVVRLSTPSGTPFAGLLLELHSTPMEATTDANGAAVFNGVEEGWHTLYVKDANGILLASKGFELLFGEQEAMEGDRIMVKEGEPFTLTVRMEGDRLTLIPAGKTAAVQEKEAIRAMQAPTVNTGDSADPGVWLVLFISFGALLAIFFWREKKTF